MKKAMFMLLILLLMVLIINITEYAEFLGSIKAEPLEVEALKGQEFEIQVSMYCTHIDMDTVIAVTKINYDKSILQYDGVTNIGDHYLFADLFDDTGEIFTDGYVSADEEIPLFAIKFIVKDIEKMPNETTIEINSVVTDGGEDIIETNLGTAVVKVRLTNNEKPIPDISPTEEPTVEPNNKPTEEPTVEPSNKPTERPTVEPSIIPDINPSDELYNDVTTNSNSQNLENASSPSMAATTMPIAPNTGRNYYFIEIIIILAVLIVLSIILTKAKYKINK